MNIVMKKIDDYMLNWADRYAFKHKAESGKDLYKLAVKLDKHTYWLVFGFVIIIMSWFRDPLSAERRMGILIDSTDGPNIIRAVFPRFRRMDYSLAALRLFVLTLYLGALYYTSQYTSHRSDIFEGIVVLFMICDALQGITRMRSAIIMHADFDYKPPAKKVKEDKYDFGNAMPV